MLNKSEEAIYIGANGAFVSPQSMKTAVLTLQIVIVGLVVLRHLIIRLPCILCGVFKPQKNCCLITFSVITLIFIISDVIMMISKSQSTVSEENVFGTVGTVNFIFTIGSNLFLLCLLVLLYKKLPSEVELTLSKIASEKTSVYPPGYQMQNYPQGAGVWGPHP
jgi:hypothetical protein